MLDRAGQQGVVIAGFMPQLASALGAGSFDQGFEDNRFAGLLRNEVPLALQFRETWQGLRAEVGDDAGMLGMPAQAAGHGSENVQKDLTRVRERTRFQRLDIAIRNLPLGDMRRAAWTNLDAFST
eukprot:2566409-Karenia_brevis.AAC.1